MTDYPSAEKLYDKHIVRMETRGRQVECTSGGRGGAMGSFGQVTSDLGKQ